MSLLLVPLHIAGSTVPWDALRLHGAAYNLTGIFFGPYCALIGWLVIRSRLVPIAIGWLMMLAGATFVFDASIELAAPQIASRIPDAVMMISLIAEGALAIWLTAFAVQANVSEASA
jgi:hypothetical protein